MINLKSVLGVILISIIIGTIYVVFEKNLFKNTNINSKIIEQESIKPPQDEKISTIISYPESLPEGNKISESTDLLNEAEKLKMRDYSNLLEDLKTSVKQ